MNARLCALLIVSVACACATSATSPSSRAARLTVRDEAGATLFDAQTTYTVRKPERVVSVQGIGEIHVGLAGNAGACRFVWSKAGLDRLAILHAEDGGACATVDEHRMCFARARFVRDTSVAEDGPRAVVVDGCVDENDLQWSKLQGRTEASVGPTTYRTRCAEVPQKQGCPLTYLHLVDLSVTSNDAPHDGFSFDYQPVDDRWRACFLEKESGPFAVALELEDACGARARRMVEGDSHDLDD